VQLHAISWFWFCLLRGAQGAREDADIFESDSKLVVDVISSMLDMP
jgi:hypothetical protein